MMVLSCDNVQDRLPEIVAGTLVGAEAQAVLAHLAECGDCAEELALVRAVRQSSERAPAALAARIRQAAPRRSPSWAHDWRRPTLVAATVGSILLGGSLLIRSRVGPDAGAALSSAPPSDTATPGPAPAGTQRTASASHGTAATADGRVLMQALPGTPEAGLYSSTATLEDLSEEELNTLLKELQS